MKHDLILTPLHPSMAPLAITLDDETLAVSGPDAAAVLDLLSAAVAVGHVVIHPWPTMVEITDIGDRGQFAAVLADRYQLPALMDGWLPVERESGPDDAKVVY